MRKLLATTWNQWLAALPNQGNRTWLAVAFVAFVLAGGGLAAWMSRGTAPSHDSGKAAAEDAAHLVRLTPTKIEAAGLHIAPVGRRSVQEMRRVPGKIGYNQGRRLELKVPVAGVVKQILAGPGQPIRQGGRLAILTSVDVGMARDEVIRAETDFQLAERESHWADEITDNLASLLKALENRPEVPYVEQLFHEKVLGDHRDKVLAAYSKYVLALRVAADTDALAKKGSISERLVQERTSMREVAAATFQSVCEQSRFDSLQHQRRKRADLEHAQRVLAVARQKMKLLLGPFAEISSETRDTTICELVLRSPLEGVIEDRFVAEGSQFAASLPLFSVVNTDTLWVSAQIYERDWAALAQSQMREVRVETPALPGRIATARVQFLGVSLSNETRAVPLVAELSNADGGFRPGMFAWVTVPLSPARTALVVPAGAVMRHENQTFAFVETGPATFRKVDVTLGLETPEEAEIVAGLKAGDTVVDQGAFFLKSELLLSLEKNEE